MTRQPLCRRVNWISPRYLAAASVPLVGWLVQAGTSLPATPSSLLGKVLLPRLVRTPYRWWANHWARMTDLIIGLVLFLMLIILSILPMSALQSKMLFNQVGRHIHLSSLPAQPL